MVGEPALVAGYALAGAMVIPAQDRTEVRRAWDDLPADTTLVILTAAAAAELGGRLAGAAPLIAVMGG